MANQKFKKSGKVQECSFALFDSLRTHLLPITTTAGTDEEHYATCINALANFLMIFVSLSRVSDMQKMANIILWVNSFGGSNVTLSQIATVKNGLVLEN